MPTLNLPHPPDLGQLRKRAKSLLRKVRALDPDAVATFREFHPSPPTDPKLADAQLVVARQHGFASWPRLAAHLETVDELSRMPHRVEAGVTDADELLRLACLSYGNDEEAGREQARGLLAAEPGLAGASIHTAAAVGDVEAARRLLDASPGLADEEGGPFRWVPLLYAAYSRLDSTTPGHSTLEVARLLLDHGADPNAGYLWEGLPSPFTALTGAFGRGEGNQPPHQFRDELARLLLDRGADPNDSQVMYNLGLGCWPVSDDSHLELLFEHGLGQGDGGPWRRRLGGQMLSPEELVHEELMYAASRDLPERARLVVRHGVDVDRRSTGHPSFGGTTPMELAVAVGNQRVVDVLLEAGATPVDDPLGLFLGACLRGDAQAAAALVEADPGLVERARERMPDLLLRAAESGRPEAMRTLAGFGMDLNDLACFGRTPLHLAALMGDREMVEVLLELGADPGIEDHEHHSTPAGWAAYAGHTDVADLLGR